MDPATLGEAATSRIRDFADAVLLVVVAGQCGALLLMWRRIGDLVERLVKTNDQRVDDAQKNNAALMTALGAARETIGAQVGATERLRETVERLRDAGDALRGNLDRIWQAFDALRDGRSPSRPRSGQ